MLFALRFKRKASRCDTPGFGGFGVVFWLFFVVFGYGFWFWVVFECFFVVFDTPVDASVFKGFGVFVFVGFAF